MKPLFRSMRISEWLNSDRNYAIGVAVYNVHGTDALLKKMFEQGYSALRAKRLTEELLKLKNVDVQEIKIEATTPERTAVTVEAVTLPEKEIPETKDAYREKWLPIYMEMNMLRHQLEQAPNNQERGKMAFKILALEQQCMALWQRRDYFIRTGSKLPEEEPAAEPFVDTNKIVRRIQTLRTYISKYSQPSDNPKRPAQLKRYTEELELLTEQLKRLENG